jgi:hypothetical protein
MIRATGLAISVPAEDGREKYVGARREMTTGQESSETHELFVDGISLDS